MRQVVAIKGMSNHRVVLAQNSVVMKWPNGPEEKRDATVTDNCIYQLKSISISEGT